MVELIHSTRKEQEKIKPEIKDIITGYLDGDMRKEALDFISFMEANGASFSWSALNTWEARRNKVCICRINLHTDSKKTRKPTDHPNWVVRLPLREGHKDRIMQVGLQHIIWSGADFCVHKDYDGKSSVGCQTTKACSGGKSINLFGKEFTGMCIHFSPRFSNPDKATINGIKRIVTLAIES